MNTLVKREHNLDARSRWEVRASSHRRACGISQSDLTPDSKTRTLIVYLHGIGDNIMLTGVLKEYKRRNPGETLDLFVLNEGCRCVWTNNPNVNKVWIYPEPQPHFWNPLEFYGKSLWRVRSYLRRHGYLTEYAKVFIPAIQTFPEILYHVSGSYGGHKIYRIARGLNVPVKDYEYDLYPNMDNRREAESIVSAMGDHDFIILHPFSGDPKKGFDDEMIGGLINQLYQMQLCPVIVGSRAEKCQLLDKWKAVSFFGLSFGTVIELLRKAVAFVGTDSSVAHLAGFANTPDLVVASSKLKPERYCPVSRGSRIRLLKLRPWSKDAAITVTQALDGLLARSTDRLGTTQNVHFDHKNLRPILDSASV